MNAVFDKTIRKPVDKLAAIVSGGGIQPPEVDFGMMPNWESCPPLKSKAWLRYSLTSPDLTGHRKGSLEVIGMARDFKARWVVRCHCGTFEIRTAKALANPLNDEDACCGCRQITQAKKHNFFHTHGYDQKDL